MNMLFNRIDARVDRNETMYVFIDVSYFDDSDDSTINKLAFIEYSTDSEVKEIDNTINMFFKQLKKDNIYKDEDSDDEFVNYLENME